MSGWRLPSSSPRWRTRYFLETCSNFRSIVNRFSPSLRSIHFHVKRTIHTKRHEGKDHPRRYTKQHEKRSNLVSLFFFVPFRVKRVDDLFFIEFSSVCD